MNLNQSHTGTSVEFKVASRASDSMASDCKFLLSKFESRGCEKEKRKEES